MENNSWKIMRKSTFSPRETLRENKKKNIRSEFLSFMKDTDKNISKKATDFPIFLTLFVKNQENKVDKSTKAQKNKNKFNIKLSSFKPINLNLKQFKLNNVIKLSEKNTISRNLNISSNSSSNILNIDSFNSSKIMQLNKFYDSTKSPKIRLKNINYTPLNINTKNSPIIINQIGIDNISTSKVSTNTKLNNLSNNSIENDLSMIRKIRNISSKCLNYNNMSINDKKRPSLFFSPLKNTKRNSFLSKASITKLKLKEIKKLFQKEVNSFDLDKKININNNNISDITNKNDNYNNIEKEKENNESININSKHNSIMEMTTTNTVKNKFNFNFKLDKDSTFNRHNSLNIINLRNRLMTKNIKEENTAVINQEKNDNNFEKIIISPIRSKKHATIIINDSKKKSSFDSKDNNKKNEVNNTVDFLRRTKTEKKSIRSQIFLKKHSKRTITTKNLNDIKIDNKYYLLDITSNKKNKFLEKIIDNKYEFQVQKKKIVIKKTKLLLNTQIKAKNSFKKPINILELTEKFAKKNEFNLVKVSYFKEIIRKESNINNILLQDKLNKNNNNCNISVLLGSYLLSSHEFKGLSSSLQLGFKRRGGKQLGLANKERNLDYGMILQETFFQKDEETFKRTKSNVFQFHTEVNKHWMYISQNLITIHEITLKEYNYDSNNGNIINNNNDKLINKPRIKRSITIKDTNFLIQEKSSKKNILQNLSPSKISAISPKTLRRKKPMNVTYKPVSFKQYSILQMKKFFVRHKKKSNKKKLRIKSLKEEKELSSLSDASAEMLSSNNLTDFKLEDNYYVLLNCIIQGLNRNFISYFQKLEKKIDINQQIYEGNTLLIFSTKEGNMPISKYLCQQGANVNIQNDLGNTALHYAIANQFFSIADILKSHGAKEDITNNKGFSPWDCIEHGLE